MPNISAIALIVISIFLTITILLQAQGTGLGTSWGGGSETYHTRRGIEKVVFVLTILLIILFAGFAIANLIFQA
jgi:preprotein translocase subunit SecG